METFLAFIDYLQKWQTLLAALVALMAARKAYAAAIAKVDFDRDLARQALISKKLALFLKLQHAMDVFQFMLDRTVAALGGNDPEDFPQDGVTIQRFDFELPVIPEIEEAWSALDLLPPDAIFPLRMLRFSMSSLEEGFHFFAPEQGEEHQIPTLSDMSDGMRTFVKACASASERAGVISQSMNAAIEVLRQHKSLI